MIPPICALCGAHFDPSKGGGTVHFTDFAPLPGPGHPAGLEWFCGTHLAPAEALRHLRSDEALTLLRDQSV